MTTSDPTTSNYDELLAAAAEQFETGESHQSDIVGRKLIAALRAEQRARQAAEAERDAGLATEKSTNATARKLLREVRGERDALQQRIDAALALYVPPPGIGIGRSQWRTADEFLVAIRAALLAPAELLLTKLDEAEKAWRRSDDAGEKHANGFLEERVAETVRADAAEERERTLIAEVTKVIGDLDRARANGTVYTYGNIQTRLRHALSRLLPSTPTEEGKK